MSRKAAAPEIEAVYVAVGARIRMIRETLGLTQEELASKLPLTRPSLVNIEKGRQRVMMHDIQAIAAAFNMSPKAFMKGIWW